MFYTVKLKTVIIIALIICALVPVVACAVTSAVSSDGVAVPIIMYHSVLKNQRRLGKYVVTPDELESDMKYLRDKGYTTVFIQDLIDYVYNGKTLPEKPVILTFDDGYYNNNYYLLPLLKKYDMKAVISIVGTFADAEDETKTRNPNFSYLSWGDMDELIKTGYIEIQNHSYDMHKITSSRNGAKMRKGESLADYEAFLNSDIMKLQNLMEEKLGCKATAFVYPFGAYSRESSDIIKKMGFLATLSCTEGVNKITKDPQCLYMLKRYNRPHNKSVASFIK